MGWSCIVRGNETVTVVPGTGVAVAPPEACFCCSARARRGEGGATVAKQERLLAKSVRDCVHRTKRTFPVSIEVDRARRDAVESQNKCGELNSPQKQKKKEASSKHPTRKRKTIFLTAVEALLYPLAPPPADLQTRPPAASASPA